MISMPRYLQQHQQMVDSTVNTSMAFQQQMFAALAAAATAGGVQGQQQPSSLEQQVQHTTRVEILGQFGLSTLHLLGTISPFLNQTICNCNKLQIDRQRPLAAADSSSSLLFPPEQVWKSFCDEVDDVLRLANFANALGRYGIILLCLVEIILWILTGTSSTGITFEFYVYLLPLFLLVPLVGTVSSVTLTSVQYLKNTCQMNSLKSFGRFRYVLEEGDVTVLPHRKKKNEEEQEEGGLGVGEQQQETSTTLVTKRRGYYITIEALDTAGIGGGALGGILGNMEMGGVMTGGTNTTTSAASGGDAKDDMPSFPISNNKIGGGSLFDQLQSK